MQIVVLCHKTLCGSQVVLWHKTLRDKVVLCHKTVRGSQFVLWHKTLRGSQVVLWHKTHVKCKLLSYGIRHCVGVINKVVLCHKTHQNANCCLMP